MKTCTKCGVQKPESDFYADTSIKRFTLKAFCKRCDLDDQKRRYREKCRKENEARAKDRS